MRLTFNIHAQGLQDYGRLLQFYATAKPTWAGVMDGIQLAKDIRAASPTTQVWHRAYPPGGDENIWRVMSPAQWVDKTRRELENSDLWAYCLNEPGFDNAMLKWLCDVIDLAVPAGLKLVVGNFSVGTPEPDDWKKPAAKWLLERLHKHRDKVILGIHEYAGGLITSGFVGGPPTELRDEFGNLQHRDFTAPANWPEPDEAAAMTMWHCGRLKFMLNACKVMGIQPPRVLITEAGFDSLKSDPNPLLRAWLDNLPTESGIEARAWRGLRPTWAKYLPQWNHEQAYFKQMVYADTVIYKGLPVEGIHIFCYGHKDPMWKHFDVEGYSGFLRLLEDYDKPLDQPIPPVIDPPALPAFPTDFAVRATAVSMWTTYTVANVREKPTTDSAIVNKLERDVPVFGWVIPKAELKPDEVVAETQSGMTGVWLPVRFRQNSGTLDGWVFAPLLTYMVVPDEPDDDTARRNVLNMLATVRTMLMDVERLVEKI